MVAFISGCKTWNVNLFPEPVLVVLASLLDETRVPIFRSASLFKILLKLFPRHTDRQCKYLVRFKSKAWQNRLHYLSECRMAGENAFTDQIALSTNWPPILFFQ